ncbi:uncharacterized protein LOC141873641 [Acropora palmata]|uniref:uncharacterized protein LOC141873641 n=1 Tax=Acropora palmata TaxID=6131 RepID=UPI003DA0F83B
MSIVHACKKFHPYIFGKEVTLYNDHRLLEQILKKPFLAAPMRLQGMILNFQWYDLIVKYCKGKEMYLTDTAYLPGTSNAEITDLEQVSALDFLSISKDKYTEMLEHTQRELNQLQTVILNGWPNVQQGVPALLRPYWDSRSELAVCDGIIYKGMRIVVPPSLRRQMLNLVHESYLGVTKCKQRAREVLYWPAMNSNIKLLRTVPSAATFKENNPLSRYYEQKLPDYPS